MVQRLTRAEIPVNETWNLDDLFRSAADWEAERSAVEGEIESLQPFKGRLSDSAATLLACLTTQERLRERFTRVFAYASLRQSEDGTNPANQAAMGQASALAARLGAAGAFIQSEILAFPEGVLERFLGAEPGLTPFRPQLEEILEQKPHTLAPAAEEALAALAEVLSAPGMIYNRSKASDMEFDPVLDSAGNQLPNSFAVFEGRYDSNPDTELRRGAWASFTRGLKRYSNTFAATFATEIKKNVVLARLRGYPGAVHMLLDAEKVEIQVHENILNIIQAELAPHFRRLAEMRRQIHGLDRLHYCELKLPIDQSYSPQISFAEASEMIREALSILGPEYMEIIDRALSERWCDLADNVGKSTGAFCNSIYGVHPYILMTWTGSMRGVYTLAHELGHAGHFGLAMKYQRIGNMRPTRFFVEAPSTMNEMILSRHILARTTDKRMRRWVILQSLGTYHHNFVTHLLEGELQRRIYALAEAGRAITARTLNETKGQVLTDFWGDVLQVDDGARMTWMRQPHYYSGLYPFTYAAGLTASTAVSSLIFEEGQPAVDRWLQVLKAGGTKKPLELMKMAGVDLSSPEPIRQAVAYVGSLVDELERSMD